MNRVITNQKEFLFVLALITIAILIAFGINLTNRPETSKGWRGIIPGQTTDREVVAMLGAPDKIVMCMKWGKDLENPYDFMAGYLYRPCSFAPLTYEYEDKRASNKARRTHHIHFRDSVVWLVIENTYAYPFEYIPRKNSLISRFGLPEQEAWDRRNRDKLLYCRQGKIIGVNSLLVEGVFYFEPMTTTECLHEFRFYLTLTPPEVIHW